ncbi:RNA methyltransferase [Candidatus Woesearchaeota archaeon]|jgi:tRNA/rRNA methyltransferase|nr:RNA methyltransferase [Candidatus Woesearchaeota archaeon]MBT3304788.1 RNA methyltransferase [Candidatus Woesearchaeota archaeon]MBT4712364.1 RNA methyltransferase [Candidatus Woesearchaeota archaeon]MBT6639276.1 RNA methyltransferase [Candidatus Woesearchaeota archaeon]MBT7496953.1 RNA methyltransferase [Candidatus Woesearchaeota archaeon]
MISIVLIEPKTQGNIGAIARVMKNFGFSELVLVNPKCSLGDEAYIRAKHAKDVLDNVKILKRWPKLDYLVATSSKTGRDYNIPRNPITPAELGKVLPSKGKIGLVFGREEDGLNNLELAKCDFMVKIPTDKDYKAMNLSHSVAVMLYSLSSLSNDVVPISLAEKKQLFKMLDKALLKMKFVLEDKRETQRLVWKKMIGKSFLSKREAYALMGFFKKLV